MGQIRRDQRRLLQEKRRLTSSGCALALAGDRQLRLLAEGDGPELQALIEANHDHLDRWLPWAAAQSLADTIAFIAAAREQLVRNDGFQAVIICAGRIAGVIGFHAVQWNHRATSLGYWLAREFEGQGTMSAAVRALTDQALLGWELNRVEIRAAAENRRSRAIPERLGFQEEGILRQAECVGPRYLDSVVYSMLAEDWSG